MSSPPFVFFIMSSVHDVCFTMIILPVCCFVSVNVHVTVVPAVKCMPVDGMLPLSHVALLSVHPVGTGCSDTLYIPVAKLTNDCVPLPELVAIVNDDGNGLPEVTNVNVPSATHLCLHVISSPAVVWWFIVTWSPFLVSNSYLLSPP